MAIVFDPAKDAENLLKHGVSLALASQLDVRAILSDDRRDYGEPRIRAFGFIEGEAYCLVFTPRDGDVRAISLRRAHARELRRYIS